MDSLILLALVAVVGIPALSLIAFVRTGRLRNLLDEQASKHQRDVSALKQEIAALHALSRGFPGMWMSAPHATPPCQAQKNQPMYRQ